MAQPAQVGQTISHADCAPAQRPCPGAASRCAPASAWRSRRGRVRPLPLEANRRCRTATAGRRRSPAAFIARIGEPARGDQQRRVEERPTGEQAGPRSGGGSASRTGRGRGWRARQARSPRPCRAAAQKPGSPRAIPQPASGRGTASGRDASRRSATGLGGPCSPPPPVGSPGGARQCLRLSADSPQPQRPGSASRGWPRIPRRAGCGAEL